jgi:hypothetical protein
MVENNGENNGENVEHMIVDVDISLEEGIDPLKATEYLENLFKMGAKFGELLHSEKLTIGEALFVIYMLEKGALSTANANDPGDIYHLLLEDNKAKMNMMANMIVKHNVEK